MLCLKLRITGFKNIKEEYELCINEDEKVLQILEHIKSKFNISLDSGEVMVVCNDKQIYLDEVVPKECKSLTIFPLAFGGMFR